MRQKRRAPGVSGPWGLAAAACLLAAGLACGPLALQPVPELQRLLAGPPPSSPSLFPAEVWEATRRFYDARHMTLAWSAQHPTRHADAALAVLHDAAAHGLPPSQYDVELLTSEREQLRQALEDGSIERLVNFDARLTYALLSLGRDVAVGRRRPEVIDKHWRGQRPLPDLAARLAQARDRGLSGWLDTLRPPHAGYRTLQRALAGLRARSEIGPWVRLPRTPLEPGQKGRNVQLLRERLVASGELTGRAIDDSPVFDEALGNAVRAFQTRHGLEPTGRVDQGTRAALNVPLSTRMRQIALNLERWRWMPQELGQRYILVNIPDFRLRVVEHGRQVLEMRAIVGKTSHETPVFSDVMTHVVFSPYWNIPETVMADEMLPEFSGDAAYLARHDIEVVRVSGDEPEPVDPTTLDWEDEESLKDIRFRQRPGTENALGLVKFLFPNQYHVYIHDTPAEGLFARRARTLSHGCVRVEDPVALAGYALHDQTAWTAPAIREAMHSGMQTDVPLVRPLPVHITYFTAWVDETGALQFRPDVYGHDARQSRISAPSAELRRAAR